jgi:dihydroneopterin aldolase
MMGKIGLEGLAFHAFHGVYAHERESGNLFEVDITVEADISAGAAHDDLRDTVNYETLFRIVKEVMDQPSHLLETVAEKIADQTLAQLPPVRSVELKLSKLSPPIGGECRKAFISLTKVR